ncbi:MAG TPA: hypothetical protein VFR41_13295 [Acidimicrobiia bacterium]|nr:hypothetical protein [Acidimicrobiia bacterium]
MSSHTAGSEAIETLDDLELELRKLPGVRAAGFEERDDMLLVQLHVTEKVERTDQPVTVTASRIAARHSDRPVAVEIVRWRTAPSAPATPALTSPPPAPATEGHVDLGEDETERAEHRARLLAVLAFPDTDELEVHLILEGRRTIGRAAASAGLLGAAEATIDAVKMSSSATTARSVRVLAEVSVIVLGLSLTFPPERWTPRVLRRRRGTR